MNIRLILAIVGSLLDEAVLLAVLIWGLPVLGIHVSLPWLIAIIVAFAIFAVVSFQVCSRALAQQPVAGFTSMVGTRGRVTQPLSPSGTVRIMGELWEARAEAENIEAGADVIVTAHDRLKLTVRVVDTGSRNSSQTF